MATKVDPALLRTLHRLLRQKTDLTERLERGPRKILVAQQAEAAFASQLQEAKELFTKTTLASNEKQLQLKQREDKIEEYKGKRNACESNREFQLFSDQIAADEQANSVLSDEILELLEKIDAIEMQLKQSESNLEKGKAETAKVKSVIDKELQSLQTDLQAINRELSEHEAKLPNDLRAEFQRIVGSIGENALAAVDSGNTCGNCYTTIITQVVSDLMMGNAVFCKSCGSLLYFPEKATV